MSKKDVWYNTNRCPKRKGSAATSDNPEDCDNFEMTVQQASSKRLSTRESGMSPVVPADRLIKNEPVDANIDFAAIDPEFMRSVDQLIQEAKNRVLTGRSADDAEAEWDSDASTVPAEEDEQMDIDEGTEYFSTSNGNISERNANVRGMASTSFFRLRINSDSLDDAENITSKDDSQICPGGRMGKAQSLLNSTSPHNLLDSANEMADNRRSAAPSGDKAETFDSNIAIKEETPDDYESHLTEESISKNDREMQTDYTSVEHSFDMPLDSTVQNWTEVPDQNFDPNIRIKTELPDDYESHLTEESISKNNCEMQTDNISAEHSFDMLRDPTVQNRTEVPDQNFDPNLRIKTELPDDHESHLTKESISKKNCEMQTDNTSVEHSFNMPRDSTSPNQSEVPDKNFDPNIRIKTEQPDDYPDPCHSISVEEMDSEQTSQKRRAEVQLSLEAPNKKIRSGEELLSLSSSVEAAGTKESEKKNERVGKKTWSEIEAALQILRKNIKSEPVEEEKNESSKDEERTHESIYSKNIITSSLDQIKETTKNFIEKTCETFSIPNFQKCAPSSSNNFSNLESDLNSKSEVSRAEFLSEGPQKEIFSTELIKYIDLNTKIDKKEVAEALQHISKYIVKESFRQFNDDVSKRNESIQNTTIHKLDSKLNRNQSVLIKEKAIVSNTVSPSYDTKTVSPKNVHVNFGLHSPMWPVEKPGTELESQIFYIVQPLPVMRNTSQPSRIAAQNIPDVYSSKDIGFKPPEDTVISSVTGLVPYTPETSPTVSPLSSPPAIISPSSQIIADSKISTQQSRTSNVISPTHFISEKNTSHIAAHNVSSLHPARDFGLSTTQKHVVRSVTDIHQVSEEIPTLLSLSSSPSVIPSTSAPDTDLNTYKISEQQLQDKINAPTPCDLTSLLSVVNADVVSSVETSVSHSGIASNSSVNVTSSGSDIHNSQYQAKPIKERSFQPPNSLSIQPDAVKINRMSNTNKNQIIPEASLLLEHTNESLNQNSDSLLKHSTNANNRPVSNMSCNVEEQAKQNKLTLPEYTKRLSSRGPCTLHNASNAAVRTAVSYVSRSRSLDISVEKKLSVPSDVSVQNVVHQQLPPLVYLPLSETSLINQQACSVSPHLNIPSNTMPFPSAPSTSAYRDPWKTISRKSVPSDVSVQNVLHQQLPSLVSLPLSETALINQQPCSVSSNLNIVSTTTPFPSAPSSSAYRDPWETMSRNIVFSPRKGARSGLYKNLGKDVKPDNFYTLILQWNPSWLRTQDEIDKCPPICDSYPIAKSSYTDTFQYSNTYIPLHMLSVWLTLFDRWKQKRGVYFSCIWEGLSDETDEIIIACSAELKNMEILPKREDIVLCTIIMSEGNFEKIFLRVTNVMIKKDKKKLWIEFHSPAKLHVKPGVIVSMYILFNARIASLQYEALSLTDAGIRDLVLKPRDHKQHIEVTEVSTPRHIKELRNEILELITPDRIQVVLVDTRNTCDIIILITQLAYALFMKMKCKVLICMKNEEWFHKLAKRLIPYGPVLAVRTKEIQISEDMMKYTLDNRLAAGTSIEDIQKNCNIFLTTFSAFIPTESFLSRFKLTCIVDEAHMCTEAETALALRFKVRKLVLMGNRMVTPFVPAILRLHRYDETLFHRLLEVT